MTHQYMEIKIKELEKRIEELEQPPILCANCKNFEESDNYCKLLQINFMPDNFGCNKGESKE